MGRRLSPPDSPPQRDDEPAAEHARAPAELLLKSDGTAGWTAMEQARSATAQPNVM